jgi:uracil-DNA glycosylase family 4
MMPKPESCVGCPLYEKGAGFSRPEGNGKNGVLIMGEALGEHESRDSLPFRPYAAAGGLLQRTLSSVRFSREEFTIWNTVACRPPKDFLEGAPWEHGAIEHCRTHFDRVVRDAMPKVILALGNVALRTLTGESGKNLGVGYLRGYPLPLLQHVEVPCFDCAEKDGKVDPDCFICGGAGTTPRTKRSDILVIGSYHPSFIRRGATNLIGVLATDIRKAVLMAKNGFQRHPVRYSLKPSLDEARSFFLRVKDSPRSLLTYDIETPNSRDLPEDERDDDPSYEIDQIQFSLSPYEGIVFPWNRAYAEIAKDILELGNTKANHNTWNYDDPRIRAKGIKIGGVIHDTMNMWRRLQPDLPAHLQFVAGFYGMDRPWKHLSQSDPEDYGCCDVDAPQRIMAKLPADMQARGVWDSYLKQTLRLHPILVGAQDVGVPINNEMRLEMKKELEGVAAEYLKAIRSRVPDDVKRIEPKRKKEDGTYECFFTGVPPEMKKWLAEGRQAPYTGVEVKVSDKGKETAHPYEYVQIDVNGQQKWVRKFEFNPGSWKQLIAYMKFKKHPVPKDLKTDDETTSAKELERLGKKTSDPIYGEVIEWRGTEKMLGTYVIGFTPDSVGRVHTTFTFAPGTGQLSSRNPNIQNIPKHSKLAKAFRRMIEAPPGFKIVEADYKSFHALTLGFEAQDTDYMRAARLDIHSLVSGQVLGVHEFAKIFEKSDPEINEYCDWYKSDKDRKFHRDKKSKPSILGIGFGLGVRKLYDMNRESFQNEGEAKRVREVIQHLFPKVFTFQDMIRQKAHNQTFLLSRFGYLRWFFDVFHWDAKSMKNVAGDDAESAIAFLPANDAFGVIKDAMVTMDEAEMMRKYNFFNTVHDSLMWLCPDKLVEECIHSNSSDYDCAQ